MKFDAARRMAWVQAFAFSRPARCAGERRAADILAEHFGRLGWHIERSDVGDTGRATSILLLVASCLVFAGYWLWAACRRSFPQSSPWLRAGLVAGGLLGMAGVARLALGTHGWEALLERVRARRRGSHRPSPNLIATWPMPGIERRVRVLFLSPLATTSIVTKWEDRAWLSALILLLCVTLMRVPDAARAWIHVAEGFGLLIWIVRAWIRVSPPCPGDNRTGLAALAELAEDLPLRLRERVEVRLAATGGLAWQGWGSLRLAEAVRRHWPAKPTLAINLDAPGLGHHQLLFGQGEALELARKAAKDLWLPNRSSRWPLRTFEHRAFLLNRIPAVSMAGDRHVTVVDPAALAASVQLATEIALRWARSAEGTNQEETAARSSQNPG